MSAATLTEMQVFNIMLDALRPLAVGLASLERGNAESYGFPRRDGDPNPSVPGLMQEQCGMLRHLVDVATTSLASVHRVNQRLSFGEAETDVYDVQNTLRTVRAALYALVFCPGAPAEVDPDNAEGLVFALEQHVREIYNDLIQREHEYEKWDADTRGEVVHV